MAEEKKKKSFRKEYLNDFSKDDSNRYVYSGEYRTFSGDRQEWMRSIILMWAACAVSAALLLVIGFMSRSGLAENRLMILPYAVELIALFITIWKLVRLTYGGEKLRKYIHASTVGQIPGYAGACAATGVIALAGIIISLLIHTFTGSVAGMIVYFAAQAAMIATGLLIMKTIKYMKWE